MLIKAEQKYVRMSPRKLRAVADVVRKFSNPQEAVDVLEVIGKRAAEPIRKTILQAIANAVNNKSLSKESLRIVEIQIGDGPTLKRWRPRARGMAAPILKRTSHIRIVLESVEPSKQEEKSENKKLEKRGNLKSSEPKQEEAGHLEGVRKDLKSEEFRDKTRRSEHGTKS